MTEFKVGDRVKMVKHSGDSMPIKIGWLGAVVNVRESQRRIGVSWDGYTNGHDCDVDLSNYDRPDESGRWMDNCCLALIERAKPKPAAKPKPTIKIGDRVVLIKDSCDSKGKLRIGWQGTVKTVSSCRYGVSWDDLDAGHNLGGVIDGLSGWNVEKDTVQLVVDSDPFEVVDEDIDMPLILGADELTEIGEALVAGLTGGSQPKTKSDEAAPERKPCCANCKEWFPLEGCEHGFCNSWHNFCTKNEFCSRLKMCG